MKNLKGIKKLEEIDKELANVMDSIEEKWKEIEVEAFNHIDICEQENKFTEVLRTYEPGLAFKYIA